MKSKHLFIRRFAVLVCAAAFVNAQSQNTAPGKIKYTNGIEMSVSANGHGAFYIPYFGMELRRNTLLLGAAIQKRSGIMNGLKISYIRDLSSEAYDPDDRDFFQMNFFSSFQYNGALPLCYSEAKYEGQIFGNESRDWNSVKLSTVELAAGFQFQVNATNAISWKTAFGAATYYHLNYVHPMDLSRGGLVFSISTGLSFTIQ